jgi:hypothetical protein
MGLLKNGLGVDGDSLEFGADFIEARVEGAQRNGHRLLVGGALLVVLAGIIV